MAFPNDPASMALQPQRPEEILNSPREGLRAAKPLRPHHTMSNLRSNEPQPCDYDACHVQQDTLDFNGPKPCKIHFGQVRGHQPSMIHAYSYNRAE